MAPSQSVAIITLTLNSARYLRKCVDSVRAAREELSASGFSSEHIIVDGGSNDETLSIVSHYDDLRLVQCPVKGLYASIDYINSCVTADYIAYVHSDDYISRNFLLCSVRAASTHGSNQFTSGHIIPASDVIFVDFSGEHLWTRRQPRLISILQKHENLVLHPNAIYPTVLEQAYPYTRLLSLGAEEQRWQDWLHINNLLKNGNKFIRVKDSYYYFRIHPFSTTVRGSSRPSDHILSYALRIVAKIYILFHESRLPSRLLRRFFTHSRNFSINNG